MEYNEFKRKVEELYVKAKMYGREVVFDSDEEGHLFVDTDGQIHFADKNWNWIKSPYNIQEVENLRYGHFYNPENTEILETNIYIHFFDGDSFSLYEDHKLSREHIGILYNDNNEAKATFINNLKEKCGSGAGTYYSYSPRRGCDKSM